MVKMAKEVWRVLKMFEMFRELFDAAVGRYTAQIYTQSHT
jgi:hypothetical protein